ncbi:MAG: serine aminopeptidase domain-containing protein [Polyangiaceae bacterium]|jgi:pimeloyl-ACP methyl ester carboxylesterase
MAQVGAIPKNDEPASAPAVGRNHAADKAACVAGRPIYFGPTHELFGFFYSPTPARRAGVVVLCPPIGWDSEATYRAYGRLAERLYQEGFAVLRFAYHGTGDSSGSDYDPERLEAWRESVKLAVEEARAQSGAKAVSLFGIRIGGLLAALAAPELGGVESMVLWAPCVAGKAYVREIAIARGLDPAESVSKGEKVAGGDEAGGFMLSASTIASLKGVNLLKVPKGAPRYLVLGRDDLPGGDAAFVSYLTECGANVSYLEPPGYQAMMVDPLESIVPEAAFDTVIRFFSEVHPLRSGSVATPADARHSPSASQLRLDSTTPPVREEAVRFGGESELFGIVTEPPSSVRPASPTGIIFLNTGANPHMGPHRMYVPLSRILAARGFTSLRFDIESFADSPPREGVPPNDSYSTYAVTNAQAAIDFLRSRGVNRIVLAGMCSGAYHAFHTALADSRVAGAIMLRPQVFSWGEGEALDKQRHKNARAWSHYTSRLSDPEAWVKAFTGKVAYRTAFETVVRRAKAVAVSELEKLNGRLRGDPTETKLVERFKTILGRGCETLLVYSKFDPGLDHLNVQTGAGLDLLKKRKNFSLVLMDGSDFTFAAIWSQDRLMEVVTRFLVERFG